MKSVLYFILSLMFLLVSCIESKERALGSNYFLTGYGVTTEIYKKGTSKGDSIVLLGEIADYNFDDKFILIYREVSEKVINHFSDHSYTEIMRGGDTIQYWIIGKYNDSIIGPLHRREYLVKRKELGVSNKLQLK